MPFASPPVDHPEIASGAAAPSDGEPELTAESIVDLMLAVLSDGLDHPELWEAVPGFVDALPDIVGVLEQRLDAESGRATRTASLILLGMCGAAKGHPALMAERLEPLAVEFSQSPLVQGALFHLRGLADPDNPKYALAGKICPLPFITMDVLESSSYLCCSSYLKPRSGTCRRAPGRRFGTARPRRRSARASRRLLPLLQQGYLPAHSVRTTWPCRRACRPLGLLARASGDRRRPPSRADLRSSISPMTVPATSPARAAAQSVLPRTRERAKFEQMQERTILPPLKGAKTVFVTGSGDPFASKNFRRLMEQLTPESYPDLGFQS